MWAPPLFDYNNLLTISVGLSFASIVFDKYQLSKGNEGGFLRLLNRSVTGFERKIAEKADKSLVDITILLPKLEFNIHNKTLSSQKEELVSSVKRELEKINDKTQQLVNDKKNKAKRAVKTDHFSKMAWISALFAIVMLIISPFTKDPIINNEDKFSTFIVVESCVNIIVLFSLITLFFIEFSEQKRYKLISFISIVAIFVALVILPMVFVNTRTVVFECSSITTVVISFIGFVVYFIKCNAHLYLLQRRFNKKLKNLQIDPQVTVLKSQISGIEKDLKEPDQLVGNDFETSRIDEEKSSVGLRLIRI
jgi:hypothetical protein